MKRKEPPCENPASQVSGSRSNSNSPCRFPVGTRVQKCFADQGVWSTGAVKEYNNKGRFYRIVYDDDDEHEEELSENELQECLKSMNDLQTEAADFLLVSSRSYLRVLLTVSCPHFPILSRGERACTDRLYKIQMEGDRRRIAIRHPLQPLQQRAELKNTRDAS
jgi:hypothetical protein